MRENRRVARLLKSAKLKAANAVPEDIDFSARRGVDKSQIMDLLMCQWIERGQHVVLTEPTGTGKTWLGCALGREATRKGLSVNYQRMPRLMEDMEVAHADGSLPALRTRLAKARLLILDDWGLEAVNAEQRNALLEIMDDRYGKYSTVVVSQLPTEEWYASLGDNTLADAILDRLMHNAHRLSLKGESMRKRRSELTQSEHSS